MSDPFTVKLQNGGQIQSGWIDNDDPDALPAGDYLSVLDRHGNQVFYAESADLFAEPIQGRRMLCEFLQACNSH